MTARPPREPWLGPLFRHELGRLARGGRQPRLRAVFVLLLLAGLCGAYLREFSGPNDPGLGFEYGEVSNHTRLPHVGENFLVVMLFAQALVVVVLTPALVGATVAAEKERGTFDLLLASPLSNRELVLGKLMAAVAAVASVLLAGLPVLALTLFFGGVDAATLLAGYVIAGTATVSHGAITLRLSLGRDGLGAALMPSYALTVGLAAFGLLFGWCPGVGAVSPFSALLYMQLNTIGNSEETSFLVNVGGFLLLHGILATLAIQAAIREVRVPAAEQSRPTRPAPTVPEPDFPPHPGRMVRRRFPVRNLLDDEDPLCWKERYFSGKGVPDNPDFVEGCGLFAVTLAACVLGTWLLVSLTGLIVDRWPAATAVNPPLRIGLIGVVVFGGFGAGVRVATSVVKERQRHTLETLFTLPVNRVELLRAKVWVAVEKLTPWTVTGGVLATVGLFTGAVHPVGLLVGGVYAGAYVAFCLMLGLWLSVRTTSTVRATVWFLLVLLASCLLPAIMALLAPREQDLAETISPVVSLWRILHPWLDIEIRPVAQVTIAAAGYGMLAVFFWRMAVSQFRMYGKF